MYSHQQCCSLYRSHDAMSSLGIDLLFQQFIHYWGSLLVVLCDFVTVVAYQGCI
ncbi:uncharacterized protein K441DRAFT_345604 [Cenococcum geophilum 1.58]|uniref:uncharacterized protein n=1 Tax=Cenococcum geophilum 1.58 TaxID=794803 RepID=UPI00358E5906|nr:hypothetical protein K441DRAFT_345604 [Cenococcum geophilum 1.58]